MMTSAEIRQSFLDFFKSKRHTIVPSSSLLPDSPNLLFTNAGMNQFVPIFLGERTPDVDRWPGAIVGPDSLPTRAADTQKCIRAGGKHNDLEDVGLDTYHHTFFEMLGNWSFGDYFKQEAIEWAWELLTQVWKFPKERLYATVYQPGEGEPAEFDEEAAAVWRAIFEREGLNPAVHLRTGGKKDNFWMMGDTGPCGPCSEIHMDLTPAGDTRGELVNAGDARCIEIWNLVFIQFNANPDGTFSPLPARHVDTGMGFERVVGIVQCTEGFRRFDRLVSNYETDVFRPLFDQLQRLSGCRYGGTLPAADAAGNRIPRTDQEKVDVAFRVIADHIRTLSFAIADGIQPGNTDRHYVLRRILRRAVRYGRSLNLHEPFLYKLVGILADTMGDVFPEIRQRREQVEETIRREEEAFNRTLDGGLRVFQETLRIKNGMEQLAAAGEGMEGKPPAPETLDAWAKAAEQVLEFGRDIDRQLFLRLLPEDSPARQITALAEAAGTAIGRLRSGDLSAEEREAAEADLRHFGEALAALARHAREEKGRLNGAAAFLLYDTYGFPLDLTQLLARENGLSVDTEGFERRMEEQRRRARAAQKREVIEVAQIDEAPPTRFVGYEQFTAQTRVEEVVRVKNRVAVILETTACYAEMGGQVGDTGRLIVGDREWRIADTRKVGEAWLHFLDTPANAGNDDLPEPGAEARLEVDVPRREAIQRHHTVTHLLHWALHEVVGPEAVQKGSYVGPDKLTFDFSSAPLTPAQVADVERLVNERILGNAPVSWVEVKYDHIRHRPDIMQFFGEKYGEWVRVVQIGGRPQALDGYAMELCGGTHTRATGEIGLFRVLGESAIAAGIRRIEAVAGLQAWQTVREEAALIEKLAGRVNSPVAELEKKIANLLEHQKQLEKQLRAMQQQQAAMEARRLEGQAQTIGGVPAILARVDADGNTLQAIANELKGRFPGVVVLAGADGGQVALVAAVGGELTRRFQAGRIIQQIAPLVEGRGGGRPEMARGGGKNPAGIEAALAKARELLG